MENETRVPCKGDYYRHFKGNVYEVIVPRALCVDNNKEYIIYRNFNTGTEYARKLDEFLSEIDREKYHDSYLNKNKRFEFIINKNDKKCTDKFIIDNIVSKIIIYNGIKVGYVGFKNDKICNYISYFIESLKAFRIPEPNFIIIYKLSRNKSVVHFGIGNDNLTYTLPVELPKELLEE